MMLEVREVSRKTARDGKLELSETSARRLSVFGERIAVAMDDVREEGTLVTLFCTCGAGVAGNAEVGGTGHQHHFVQSPLFTALTAGETVVIELLEGPLVAVARPHPLRPKG